MSRNLWVHSLEHFLVEACHVVRAEGWSQCDRLVEHTAERPNVGLHVVGLISPHFGTCVVGRSCLSVEQSLLRYFGNVHVAEFGRAVLVEEYVGTLEISVENFDVMQCTEALDNLNKDPPNFFFFEVSLFLLVVGNFLEKVAVVRVLHHNA